MPLTISDRAIRTAYKTLEQSITGNKKAGLDELRDLLAAVADKAGLTSTSAKEQLKNAVSTQEMLAIVQEGLSDREKKDLGAILDNGTVKLTDDAKKFLEQVIGRAPVNPTNGPVQLTAMKNVSGGTKVEGTAKPNVTIEVINLSAIPTMRLHDDNTFELGKTDANGKFVGTITGDHKLDGGDWVRIRTRDAQGNVSDWQVVRADQLGADTRAAEVALHRIELSVDGNKIKVANNNNSRPISEPFAQLQFTNKRTGDVKVIKLDDTGRFGGVPELPGKGGDTFSISATDGRSNTDFKKVLGELQVPGGGGGGGGVQLPDPLPHKDDLKPDGSSRYELKRYTGPLFKDGVSYDDVVQGNIGDCYLPAAAAAIAAVRPDLIKTMIKDDGNGQYTFTFKDGNGRDKKISVDADLWSRSWGGPLYGASSNSTSADKMELWWPLFEKAYAQLNGTYNDIGDGGSSADVFEAVFGRSGVTRDFSTRTLDSSFNLIKDKLAKKLPVCMGTKDDHDNADFANAGVYGDHTYSVLDAFEKNGVKYLKVRNPWGESEPTPGDGKNDGVFVLKLSEMPKWFSVVWSVDG